jgi:L-ascorbate metabolism protein UlaG (beta-lactamase superfamily)
MKPFKLLFVLSCILILGCNDKKEKTSEITFNDTENIEEMKSSEMLNIQPIEHATMVLTYGDAVIYVDPVGGAEKFEGYKKPNYVLITDIHGDHLDAATLEGLDLTGATVIAPKAVMDKLPKLNAKEVLIMNNGETRQLSGMSVEAIPMYNLREEALKFHEKGRGNGYVLTLGMERIYISGDTEDIPEMRNLKDIDIAFVCMNLPYTMTVESAANAVLEFKPKKVYPYHYRGTEGLSDVNTFKSIVNSNNPDIEVMQLNWYK